MLQLRGEQVEILWDEVLPDEVRQLPAELAAIERTLDRDAEVLAPIVALWREQTPRGVSEGRPTIPMATYVRLMVLKHRHGWGYETLMREVSDSLHLRRFCLVPLDVRVPCESTVRKMTRRLGAETVNEISRIVIEKAVRETRFKPRAVRIDSTVVEADIRFPRDSQLAGDAARMLASAGRKAGKLLGECATRVRDRSGSIGRTVREIGRSARRRTGQAKQQVAELTAQTGDRLQASIREAGRLAGQLRRSARGRGARVKLAAAEQLEELLARSRKVASQIERVTTGQPVTDRLVSMSDPDVRPVRKGKLGKPTEFGYVTQLAEVTPHTKRGARGFILPAATAPGNAHENTLLPQTIAEIQRLDLPIREAAVDGGFGHHKTAEQMAPLDLERLYVAGRPRPDGWSRRTQRRLARYRTGTEGRISHVKRSYGLNRSRLKGQDGSQIWTAWGSLAYNLDTHTHYTT